MGYVEDECACLVQLPLLAPSLHFDQEKLLALELELSVLEQ
jgi:hypothetical protein